MVTLDERRCSPAVGERVDQGDDGKTDEGKLTEDKRWKHLYNGGDEDYLEEDWDEVYGDDNEEQVIDCAPEISLPGDWRPSKAFPPRRGWSLATFGLG